MKIVLKHDMAKLRADALEKIEATIGLYRSGLVSGSIQLDVYRKKLQEAEAVLENASVECVFLETEAIQRGITLVEMANLVIQRDKEFTQKLAEIEEAKVRAVQDVKNADTPEKIDSASMIDIPNLQKKRGLVFKAKN